MTSPNAGANGADPYGILERQRQRLAGVRERAQRAQVELAENSATSRSADGAVEVTVNAGGQLQALHLGAKAQGKTMPQLTEAIMKAYGQACAQAAARTLDIVSELSGEDSVTVRSMKAQLPAEVAASVEEIRSENGQAR